MNNVQIAQETLAAIVAVGKTITDFSLERRLEREIKETLGALRVPGPEQIAAEHEAPRMERRLREQLAGFIRRSPKFFGGQLEELRVGGVERDILAPREAVLAKYNQAVSGLTAEATLEAFVLAAKKYAAMESVLAGATAEQAARTAARQKAEEARKARVASAVEAVRGWTFEPPPAPPKAAPKPAPEPKADAGVLGWLLHAQRQQELEAAFGNQRLAGAERRRQKKAAQRRDGERRIEKALAGIARLRGQAA